MLCGFDVAVFDSICTAKFDSRSVIVCNFLLLITLSLVYACFAVDISPISPYLLEHLRREIDENDGKIICM